MRKLLFLACFLFIAPASASLIEGELTVWISADRPHRGLSELGKRFEQETGVPVRVHHPSRMASMYERDAGAGIGPDIIFETHGMLSQWEQAGLISTVRPDREFITQFTDSAWQALRSRYTPKAYTGFL